ncbi:MAG: hydrolase [Tepidiformaceae bacterium]
MSERRRVRLDRRGAEVDASPTGPAEPIVRSCDCPRLDADDWHDVENDWSDITFVGMGTTALLGVPVGFAGARSALRARAAKLGLTVPEDAMLLLGAGKFRRQIMLEVEGAEPGQKGVDRPGGMAYTRLLPAPWGEMQRVVGETKDAARIRYGKEPDELYVWYLTCRTCSQARQFETLIVAHYKKSPARTGDVEH